MQATVPIPIFGSIEQIKDLGFVPTHILASEKPDYQQAQAFLYSYRGSEATFNSYRREIERFLQWCWLIKKAHMPDIKRLDIEQYIEFCQNPPKAWIATQHYPRYINDAGFPKPNEHWRPFVLARDKKVYQLSQSALQAIFAVLSSFFTYLAQEDYVTHNPVTQVRQKSKFLRRHAESKQIRRLSELQWRYVVDTAERLAAENPAIHERTLFIMNALFGMYLRISELAASARWQPQMGDFFRDHDGNWWFRTVGKGNKERMISVSDTMLNALKRYRSSLDLPQLPSPGDTMPLILKNNGKGAISSTRRIRMIVQDCFDAAINQLNQDGFTDEAHQLQAATVHWLRHTGISEDVKHRPREHVRDDAGHASSAVTDRYIDVELRARHASGKRKKIKPD